MTDTTDVADVAVIGLGYIGLPTAAVLARAGLGVVGIIRSEKAKVTTIDSVGQIAASVSTPLALASTRAGTTGHYGFDKGAEAVMPPVTK